MSQRDAVLLFEQAIGKEIKVERVPIEALRAQHQSLDPLQKTFAALMLRYAQGNIVPDAVKNAEAHGLELESVSDLLPVYHVRAAATTP